MATRREFLTNLFGAGTVGLIAACGAVFAFNFLGDALRDWLDPQFRRRA
jgi:ABC-type dipeptide/oligopeptide/nickel transport system permease subunit